MHRPAAGRSTTGSRRGMRRDRHARTPRFATAAPDGSRNSCGHRCQPAPRRSVSTTKTAQRSSAAPRSARQAENAERSIPAAQMRSSARILSAATRPRSMSALGIHGAAGRDELGELAVEGLGTRNLLDPQVQRAAEAPRARVVRARLGHRTRIRGAERPDGQEAGTRRGGPRAELPQVCQVAHPPAAPRSRGGQLDRPAPRPQAGRQVATAGARDHQLLAGVVAQQAVIAVRRVGRHGLAATQGWCRPPERARRPWAGERRAGPRRRRRNPHRPAPSQRRRRRGPRERRSGPRHAHRRTSAGPATGSRHALQDRYRKLRNELGHRDGAVVPGAVEVAPPAGWKHQRGVGPAEPLDLGAPAAAPR